MMATLSSTRACTLLRLDALLPDHLAPKFGLISDELGARCGGSTDRLQHQLPEFLSHLWFAEALHDVAIDLLHKRTRCFGRGDEGKPRYRPEAWQCRLGDCHHV